EDRRVPCRLDRPVRSLLGSRRTSSALLVHSRRPADVRLQLHDLLAGLALDRPGLTARRAAPLDGISMGAALVEGLYDEDVRQLRQAGLTDPGPHDGPRWEHWRVPVTFPVY